MPPRPLPLRRDRLPNVANALASRGRAEASLHLREHVLLVGRIVRALFHDAAKALFHGGIGWPPRRWQGRWCVRQWCWHLSIRWRQHLDPEGHPPVPEGLRRGRHYCREPHAVRNRYRAGFDVEVRPHIVVVPVDRPPWRDSPIGQPILQLIDQAPLRPVELATEGARRAPCRVLVAWR